MGGTVPLGYRVENRALHKSDRERQPGSFFEFEPVGKKSIQDRASAPARGSSAT